MSTIFSSTAPTLTAAETASHSTNLNHHNKKSKMSSNSSSALMNNNSNNNSNNNNNNVEGWAASDSPNDLQEIISNSNLSSQKRNSKKISKEGKRKASSNRVGAKKPLSAPSKRSSSSQALSSSSKKRNSSTKQANKRLEKRQQSRAVSSSNDKLTSNKPQKNIPRGNSNAGNRRTTGSMDVKSSRNSSSGGIAAAAIITKKNINNKMKKGSLLPAINGGRGGSGSRKSKSSTSSSARKKSLGQGKSKSNQKARLSSTSPSTTSLLNKRKSTKSKSLSQSSKNSAKKAAQRGKVSKRQLEEHSSSISGTKRKVTIAFAHLLDIVVDNESELRATITAEEELERDNYIPMYNVLVMEIVRAQLNLLNARQQLLNDTFNKLQMKHGSIGEDGKLKFSSLDNFNEVIDEITKKIQSNSIAELTALRAENTTLRDRLEEKQFALERQQSEVNILRNSVARSAAQREAQYDRLRDEVRGVMQRNKYNVDIMKKELVRYIDVACAHIRTPQYTSALRSLQEAVNVVKSEIQSKHDELEKMILSIGAEDLFKLRANRTEIDDVEDEMTMHSNFPIKFRDGLRKLNCDQLLNVLDVLSFNNGTVETVGKALFVMSELRKREEEKQNQILLQEDSQTAPQEQPVENTLKEK